MKKKVFLGIDTSNYMTSICFIDENRKIIYEGKKLLEVKEGEKGIQQSQAVFQHIKNLPELFKQNENNFDLNLLAIAVSKKPRPTEGSYMPVFLPGVALAESMAAIFNIPLFDTTHQEGHIASGIYSSTKQMDQQEFLAVHLSGGTSELLFVRKNNFGYNIEKLGGTYDLHAGQLVDRIGVILGLSFPAGKYLEEMASLSTNDFNRIPSSVKDLSFYFSGAEAEAKRRISKGESKANIARAIEHVIALTIEKVLKKAINLSYPQTILLVGGVAQNLYIRDYLTKKLEHPSIKANLYFAARAYSGDNAFGVANIALDQYITLKKKN